MSVAAAAIRALRPRQWAKNVLVLVALVFSMRFTDPASIALALLAFTSFSLLASAGYILNDYVDREADRRHPKKKHRPIASGALPESVALGWMAVVLAAGVTAGALVSWPFLAVALAYLATTLSYSFYFKHRVILDVMVLGSCYLWRVIGGAVAISVATSEWLFLCTAFLALFIGFNKRRAELVQLGDGAGTRRNLALYSVPMLDQFQGITTSAVTVTYALYAVLGSATPWMILTLPYVLFAIFRYIYLVDQRGEGDSPDETLTRDGPILLTAVLYGLTAVGVLLADQWDWLPPLGVRTHLG